LILMNAVLSLINSHSSACHGSSEVLKVSAASATLEFGTTVGFGCVSV
jgi:hypothetical protein